MCATKNVQNTHNDNQLRQLHLSLLEIMGMMNRPQQDDMLIREAGIPLDRALFPMIVVIERFGPIGVVELADRVGRDYTTVSRQVAKLESLGLVGRQSSSLDRRVREAVVTEKGKAITDAVDAARARLVGSLLKEWDVTELDELVRLIQKLVATLKTKIPLHADK